MRPGSKRAGSGSGPIRASSAIDFDALVVKIEGYIDGAEFGLVEGTGGLLTPVTWEWNMTDLARDLGACALVVGEDRLGTINHTLLTLSALELAGNDVQRLLPPGACRLRVAAFAARVATRSAEEGRACAASAAAVIRSTSSTHVARGFSTNTWQPLLSAEIAS